MHVLCLIKFKLIELKTADVLTQIANSRLAAIRARAQAITCPLGWPQSPKSNLDTSARANADNLQQKSWLDNWAWWADFYCVVCAGAKTFTVVADILVWLKYQKFKYGPQDARRAQSESVFAAVIHDSVRAAKPCRSLLVEKTRYNFAAATWKKHTDDWRLLVEQILSRHELRTRPNLKGAYEVGNAPSNYFVATSATVLIRTAKNGRRLSLVRRPQRPLWTKRRPRHYLTCKELPAPNCALTCTQEAIHEGDSNLWDAEWSPSLDWV
jgi:hypothetical protein